MQVEHKTEKGTVLFVKVPGDSFGYWINPIIKHHLHYHTPKLEGMSDIDCHTVELSDDDFVLIGLTSEVTKEQCKLILPDKEIVGEYDNGLYTEDWYGYIDYIDEDNSFSNALDSFKSLMQHLKVYEVNPHEKPPTYAEQCWIDQYKNAESRTCLWVVLFKEN